ncbi:DeoR/GlpR family DNA-binding transcription regulator [Rubrobacter radiotolerans]|uniref:DeoR/GlpR family DNA-binding transcription regulator n=1 Tax=Rubrobacter radiotolerans TaxID=42256 RepID=A0AB35T796_RUBRA|nr:DeoR/GlpR family DNA-binding transcription regulator [Rubrobacter radiotolerans]MDX5895574.1 DeoR/GlpR family DNA-binding transcription regulator [Rubrobacter radiotolerans]
MEVRGDGDTRAFGPEARREWISDEVLREGYVSAREIADRFGVSVMTVYRDLDELEERRILRRERGGATAQPSSVFESDVRYRILRCVREKEALCQRALEEVSPGEAVMFDDSTTILPLARAVGERAPLTVMTNFRLAIEAALGKRGVRVLCLGGEYFPTYDSYTGLLCDGAISAVRPDVLFASPAAIYGDCAFHQEQEIVRTKRAMMEVSRRRILLADHTKFGRTAALKLAELREFDLVLTDDRTPPEALEPLDKSGVPYDVVSVPGP